MAVRRAFLELERFWFAGRLAAFEQHVAELGDRRAGRDVLELALAQHRGFEGELRRQSGAHLLFGSRRAGLVVEDDVAAVGVALDAVGDAAQFERAVAERDIDFAANLGDDGADAGAARDFPAREPARDALEARPPEGARLGIIVQRGEMRPSQFDERACRIVRQLFGEALREFADGGVDEGAALGGAGFRADRIERGEPQDVLGVDRIRVAQPVLDLGHRKARRPCRARRFRRRLRLRRNCLGPVELARPGEIIVAALARVLSSARRRPRRGAG